jgi:hypothetical protein
MPIRAESPAKSARRAVPPWVLWAAAIALLAALVTPFFRPVQLGPYEVSAGCAWSGPGGWPPSASTGTKYSKEGDEWDSALLRAGNLWLWADLRRLDR